MVVTALLGVRCGWAAEPVYELDIAAMEASEAIKELAEQTGHSVLFLASDVDAVETRAIAGTYTVEDALTSLLKQTDLTYSLETRGVIAVTRTNGIAKESQEMQINDPKPTLLGRVRDLLASVVLAPATVAGLTLSATPAAAQAPVADDDDRRIEVIVVTAEKREEDILDVPMIITAFNGQMIEELGLTRKDDLEQLVPGLQFGETHSRKGSGTVIRGMGNRSAGELQGNMAVATYVDGVYHTSQSAIVDGLFDVERVEVARGPQGTLHGRNSIAGAISVHSIRPTDEWDLNTLVEYTDQFSQRYGVAGGGPLTDYLSFRTTATYHDGQGAQENVGSGPDNDAPQSWGVRQQFRFHVDRLDVNLSYNIFEDTGSTRVPLMLRDPPRDSNTVCFSWRDPLDPRSRDPSDPLFICNEEMNNFAFYLYDKPNPAVEKCGKNTPANRCDEIENKVVANRPAVEDTYREGWSVVADYDLTPQLVLRYSYGTTQLDEWSSHDNDRTDRVPGDDSVPQDCLDSRTLEECQALFPWGTSDGRTAFPYSNDETSHEIQVLSNFEGPLNFIVGAYDYEGATHWSDAFQGFGHSWRFGSADEKAQALGFADCQDYHNQIVAPQLADPEGPFGESLAEGRQILCPPSGQTDFTTVGGSANESIQETQAVFASVDYALDEQWTLSGGLRYTRDENIQVDGSDYGYETSCPLGHPTCASQGMFVPLLNFWNQAFAERARRAATDCVLDCVGRIQEWDAIIYNGNIEYRPDDKTLFYGRISTGYRAGGLPSQTAGIFPPIEEETVINYEAGLKGLFFDDRLLLTAGGYYNDYDGFQINAIMDAAEAGYPQAIGAFSSSPLVEFTTNVDGTAIYGVDVEWTYFLNDSTRVSGYYAYLDSTLGEFATVVQDDPDPEIGMWTYIDWETGEQVTGPYIKPRNLQDGKLPQQAKHKAAVTVAHDLDVVGVDGQVQLLGTWSYTGDRYALVQNAESNRMPAYDRLDLRAAWTSVNEQWSATLYVQNALDEIGFVEYVPGFRPDWAFNAQEGYAQGVLTEPRQVGLQVRWRPQL
ncbi:MAG: TonB-dependent receptor [Gammaproteobacteria bacterium]|nr:TonB-dependent receptor [Gammaproteobacteria bacterium]